MSELAKSCQKLPNVAKCCQNWPKLAIICQKLPKFAKIGQKLPKVAKSCQNLPKLRHILNKMRQKFYWIGPSWVSALLCQPYLNSSAKQIFFKGNTVWANVIKLFTAVSYVYS